MDYVINNRSVIVDPEIRRYRKDSFAISHMASDEEVEANEQGQKIVPIGTLLDKDGKICKITGGSIEGTPVGISVNSVDVTYGPQQVAIYTRGHLQGELLNFTDEEYSDEIGTAIETALPEIHIYPRPPKAAAGAGAAAAPTTVDLSKATGTLAIKNGGTGATSAEEALTALGGAKDTEFQKVKATVEEQHPE